MEADYKRQQGLFPKPFPIRHHQANPPWALAILYIRQFYALREKWPVLAWLEQKDPTLGDGQPVSDCGAEAF